MRTLIADPWILFYHDHETRDTFYLSALSGTWTTNKSKALLLQGEASAIIAKGIVLDRGCIVHPLEIEQWSMED